MKILIEKGIGRPGNRITKQDEVIKRASEQSGQNGRGIDGDS